MPANIAADLYENLISNGIKIAAELYGINRGTNLDYIKMLVLAPPGYSLSSRMKAKND